SSASTISLTLTAQDAGSVIRVNGSTVASGVASAPITLTGASTPIDVLVTAENGTSTKTYRITVLKGLSGNAYLSKISLYPYNITQVTGSSDLNYATTIGSSVNSVWLTLTAQDAGAVIRINGTVQASGTTYGPIAISNTTTQVSVLVTAENGTSIKTYGITINRPAPVVIAAVNKNKDQINVIQKPDPTPDASADELVVKQAVSPNGDGINDRFTIQGINAFPENTVRIMNRNGDVVYEAKGYDNENKAFDGHNSRGTLQQAGTYFYSVEYKKGTETKRKTGYIVVKY
ncbi:T9SS type B sorting domain-containing protein, partial [Mucilaginibacter gilvus]